MSFDNVHHLRVSMRRLLALLKLASGIDSRFTDEAATRSLKRQLDQFNVLRDIQVMLTNFVQELDSLRVLEPLLVSAQLQEERERVRLKHFVRHVNPKAITRRVDALTRKLSRRRLRHLDQRIQHLVDRAFAKVSKRLDQVDLKDPDTIHRQRVAFKQFRYMLELIHPLLPGYPKENLLLMADYQTTMGVIQDLRVAQEVLAQSEDAPSLLEVRRHYRIREQHALTDYAMHRDDLARFWRADEKTAFPWLSGSP